MKVLLTG